MFLAANLTKLVHGAWLPMLIAVVAFTVLTTWQRGQEIVTRARTQAEGPLREFVDKVADGHSSLQRVPGTAVFLNRGKETTPLAMRANVEHNRVLHEHVVIMAIDTLLCPRVPESERTEVDDLGYGDDGIIHLTARFGYMDKPDVLAVLHLLNPEQTEGTIAIEDASYFLSKLELVKGTAPNMARWRKQLFIATSHITADAADYFGLPPTARWSWARGSRFSVNSRTCRLTGPETNRESITSPPSPWYRRYCSVASVVWVTLIHLPDLGSWSMSPSWMSDRDTCSVACSELMVLPDRRGQFGWAHL